VVTPDGRFIGSSSKQEADELAEQMGASAVRNTEYDYKQAQQNLLESQVNKNNNAGAPKKSKYRPRQT
jgi:hypothetical protein